MLGRWKVFRYRSKRDIERFFQPSSDSTLGEKKEVLDCASSLKTLVDCDCLLDKNETRRRYWLRINDIEKTSNGTRWRKSSSMANNNIFQDEMISLDTNFIKSTCIVKSLRPIFVETLVDSPSTRKIVQDVTTCFGSLRSQTRRNCGGALIPRDLV